jgi:H+/Cl- antiporter ClcA
LDDLLSRRIKGKRLVCLFYGGLLGILILMILGHVAIWYPLYGGGHMSSTASIAFFFIPFYCIVSMGIGLFAGWLISLLPFFKNEFARKDWSTQGRTDDFKR